MGIPHLVAELRRRRVFRVAAVYAATGFVVLQAADLLAAGLGLPGWFFSALTILVLLGFPIALVLAWAFDLTPEGVVRAESRAERTEGGGGEGPPPALLGRWSALLTAALVVLGVGLGAGWFLKPGGIAPANFLADTKVGAATDKSIAVLPFADFSPGGGQEWFSDGLTEEILNALARLPDLRVASRTGSFRYKGSREGVGSIAATLGVAHILEGSVRRTGDRVRITAQLIRASDGMHLWAQSFDRGAADVIQVQEEIAYDIARTMQTALEPEALRQMVAAGTHSVAAYEAFLRAQHLNQQSSLGEFSREALAAFEEAAAIDPQFADAHLALADFWMEQMLPATTTYGATVLSHAERQRRAEEHLEAAIVTASDEVRRIRAEELRAQLHLRLRDALELARRRAELQPLDAEAWSTLGSRALRVGEHALSAAAFQRASEVADNEIGLLVGIFNRSHRVDLQGALALVERVLGLAPNDPGALYQSHRVLLWAGRTREAATLADRFHAVGASDRFSSLVQIRQACAEGRTADAVRVLQPLLDDGDQSTRWLALMYLGRHSDAASLLLQLDEAGQLFTLTSYLDYTFFDPRPFPSLNAALRRQGIVRPPPVEIPYACKADRAATPPRAEMDLTAPTAALMVLATRKRP